MSESFEKNPLSVEKEPQDETRVAQETEAPQELARVRRELEDAREHIRVLEEQNRSLQFLVQEKVKEAETDSRTGLLNKLGFDRRIRPICAMFSRQENEHEKRADIPASLNLLVMDIDNFKSFNDRYGHAAGDEVIKGVADVLRRSTRNGDIICRWGGEEFVVAFMSAEKGAAVVAENRAIVAEKIRREIERATFEYEGTQLRATVSIGASQIRRGETYEEFFVRADLAMLKAKERGRNRIIVAELEEEADKKAAPVL